jgi:hypothetical protein
MNSQTPITDMTKAVSELLELARVEKDDSAALAFLLGYLEQAGKGNTATARTVGEAAEAAVKFLQEQADRRTR